MGIMLPISLSGDALEDKYRGFMKETKTNIPSKAVPINKKNKGYQHEDRKEIIWMEKDEYTTFVENDTKRGMVVRYINTFFSWVKSFSTGNIFVAILVFIIFPVFIVLLSVPMLVLLSINNLLYLNPLAIFGSIWDVIILWFKLFFAIFGWYI